MKALFIVAQQNYRDEELDVPKSILESEGIECDVSSVEKGIARGINGGSVEIKKSLYDIHLDEYDAIIFIGGSGALTLLNYPVVARIAVNAYEQKKLIGAICIAPVLLAEAGVLYKKNATVFLNEISRQSFLRNKVNLVELDVVQDGNIITANSAGSAEKFGKALLNELKRMEKNENS